MSPRVIDAGAIVHALTIPDEADARRMRSEDKFDRVRLELCYCSVFDDCWVQTYPGEADPDAVKACPAYGAEAFGN